MPGLSSPSVPRLGRTWRVALALSVASAGAASCGAGAPARQTSPSSRSAPSTTSPKGAEPAVSYTWEHEADSSLDIGGGATSTLSAVLAPPAPGDPWLIVGTRTAGDGATTATVWSATNTANWHAANLTGADGRASAAAVWGTKTVVVGSVGAGHSKRAAVWISPGPGQPFAAVPAVPAFAATAESPPGGGAAVTGSASMNVVGAGTEGVFVTGAVSGRPAMWYSTNGTDWQRVPGAERLIAGARDAKVSSILVDANEVYVAGSVQAGTNTAGALWVSNDGISWRTFGAADNPFVGPGDHVIEGLVADGASLVAVGAVRSGQDWTPATWVSPDGATWSEADEALPAAPQPNAGSGGTVVRAVAASAGGATQGPVVAVGGSVGAQRIWSSPSGEGWSEVAMPPSTAEATNWSADLVASYRTTTVVVDSQAGQPRVLVRDRLAWTDVTAHSDVFGPTRATATPAGFLDRDGRLLAFVDVVRPGRAIGAPAEHTVVVVESADGQRWSILSRGAQWKGATVNAVTTSGGKLVAVGTRPSGRFPGTTAAVMWTSSDGRHWTQAASFESGSRASLSATAVSGPAATPVAAGWGPRSRTRSGSSTDLTPSGLAWTDAAVGWKARGALDAAASLGAERPLGACTNGKTTVVVGSATRTATPAATSRAANQSSGSGSTSVPKATTTTLPVTGNGSGPSGQGDDGTVAAAWSTSGSSGWTAGTVSPLTGVGGGVEMLGCQATPSGFVAYGQEPSQYGQEVPATWASPDGSTWTLTQAPNLEDAGSAPFTDLAVHGSKWIAVSGGSMPAASSPTDPATPVDDPLVASDLLGPTTPGGAAGVWMSTDGGTSWAQIGGGPIAGGPLGADRIVTFAGKLVVIGQSGGRLAVWLGMSS